MSARGASARRSAESGTASQPRAASITPPVRKPTQIQSQSGPLMRLGGGATPNPTSTK
jgi:hypothetical protein